VILKASAHTFSTLLTLVDEKRINKKNGGFAGDISNLHACGKGVYLLKKK